MKIRPIRTNDDLTAALARIDALWGKEPGTPEGDELDILVALVEHYEKKHLPVDPAHRKNLITVLAEMEPLGPEDQFPEIDDPQMS